MTRPSTSCAMALVGVLALVAMAPASAQIGARQTLNAPDYGSDLSTGPMSNGNFNTPESDGRPGVKFFVYGVKAFKKGDYRHAVDMYKVAASWAYKAAEYNLGVMYFKGQGVPADRPLGAAWMILAAERGNRAYVRARDVMVTLLSNAQFKRTDAIWNRLKETYGDAIALPRAKAQWAWVKTHQTGTRVGGTVGELRVGTIAPHGAFKGSLVGGSGGHFTTGGALTLLSGGSIDGSVAYRQFHESNNPYDPLFLQGKPRSGTVTVEPLEQVKPKHTAPRSSGTSPTGASHIR